MTTTSASRLPLQRMLMLIGPLLAATFGLTPFAVAAPGSANDLDVVCSLDRPAINSLQTVDVDVFTNAPDRTALKYRWTAVAGGFTPPYGAPGLVNQINTSSAEWHPDNVKAGPYKLTATITAPASDSATAGLTKTCSVTVVVTEVIREPHPARRPPLHARRPPPPAPAPVASGPPPAPAPVASGAPPAMMPAPPPPPPAPMPTASPAPTYGYSAGRALLVRGQPQQPGFGLYSYMLLGAPPDDEAQARFLAFINSYLQLIPDVKGLEGSLKPAALNITYMPVDTAPPDNFDAAWVLQHYDYGQARALLAGIPGTSGRGPFIISALKPLDGSEGMPRPNLFEDLSGKPASVVQFWVNQFLIQTTQQQFWQASTLKKVALNLRTAIAYAAEGFPMVQKALPASLVFNAK
jgi:hypothetical protein